jgi:hypothetical protein
MLDRSPQTRPSPPMASRIAASPRSLKRSRSSSDFCSTKRSSRKPDVLESIDLGSLNNLKYAPDGRVPTEGEWRALDQKLASLTPLLSPALRWKFCIRELHFFFITVPIFFMATTIIATLSLALLMTFGDGESFFFVISYVMASLIWALSQGALGACAFLCVNATVHALKEQSASTI